MRGDDDVAGAVAGDGAGALSRGAVTEHHKCSDFLCERVCRNLPHTWSKLVP